MRIIIIQSSAIEFKDAFKMIMKDSGARCAMKIAGTPADRRVSPLG